MKNKFTYHAEAPGVIAVLRDGAAYSKVPCTKGREEVVASELNAITAATRMDAAGDGPGEMRQPWINRPSPAPAWMNRPSPAPDIINKDNVADSATLCVGDHVVHDGRVRKITKREWDAPLARGYWTLTFADGTFAVLTNKQPVVQVFAIQKGA